MSSRPILTFLLATVVMAACDDTFTPIASTDLDFSIFGYLDASADTQWIRVMPIRPTTLTPPGPLGATVTLENVATGRVTEMRDSVFRFLGNPDVGSDGVFLHNYWTTEPIEPGATYRFSVEQDAGKTAEADIAIPPEYQVEVWIAQNGGGEDLLRLVGLRHVALVEIVSYFFDTCGPGLHRFSVETTPADSVVQRISLSRPNLYRSGCGSPTIDKRDLFIAGSGAEWPRGQKYSPRSLSVSDSMSNVSNSVGFLGGVLTRLIPYESCQIINADPSEYCRLRYDDPAVASLRGTVTDPLCTGEGVAGATVKLRELDPVPPAKPRLRFMDTNESGAFEIGALEPGRYALGVSRYTRGVPLDQYEEHADTLTFAPGEQRTYDVGLLRFVCPSE